MNRRILHVATNVAHFDNPAHPTGLWLSELTHAWDVFADKGFEQHIVSPRGGKVPLEPKALKWPMCDQSARAWLNDPQEWLYWTLRKALMTCGPGIMMRSTSPVVTA